MDDITTTGASGGVGGILGAIFAWLGFKGTISNMRKDIKEIRDGVIWKGEFEQFEKRFETLEASIKGLGDKIDSLGRK